MDAGVRFISRGTHLPYFFCCSSMVADLEGRGTAAPTPYRLKIKPASSFFEKEGPGEEEGDDSNIARQNFEFDGGFG